MNLARFEYRGDFVSEENKDKQKKPKPVHYGIYINY